MKNSRIINFLAVVSLVFSMFAIAPTALALGKPDNVGKDKIDTPAVGKQLAAENRLNEGKLKSCQAKENAIQKRAAQLTKLATIMQTKFDAIAGRVENYYTTKVVPSGKTVANYDALLAQIQIKKEAVQTALTTAQNDANSFTCTSDNPKGQLTQFRTDMQAVKAALKDYRTSIKNLIVAVRTVVGTTETNK